MSEIQTILESIDYYTPTKLYFKLNKVQTAPLIQDGKANFPFPDSITPQSNSEQIISIIKRPFDFDHFEKFLDRYPRYWDWCWRKSFKTELLCLQNSQFWIHELKKLGFDVPESQSNFLFAKPPKFPAELWLQKLRDEKILVRWFKYPEIKDRLRISIGSDAEADALIAAAMKIIG